MTTAGTQPSEVAGHALEHVLEIRGNHYAEVELDGATLDETEGERGMQDDDSNIADKLIEDVSFVECHEANDAVDSVLAGWASAR